METIMKNKITEGDDIQVLDQWGKPYKEHAKFLYFVDTPLHYYSSIIWNSGKIDSIPTKNMVKL